MRRSLWSCVMLFSLALPAWAADPVADAAALLKAKDPRAEATIKGLVKSQPRNPEVHILQARLWLQKGEAEEAVDAAERAVDLAPDSAQAHYWLGNSYGNRIGQVGMLSQAMMAPKLRDAFERAVQLDPDLHDARISLVEYYLQAPAIAGGSVDKARAQAAELARRDPPRGHYARGRIATMEKKPAEAAQAFAAAYAARPDNKDYRMMAGLGYQETAQWPKAFALFEAWTAEDPKSAMAWYQLGRTSALSGQRLDIGAAALKQYLTLPTVRGQPGPQHAWYRLGQVQAHAGDKAAARASFERAIKAEPDNAQFKAALAAL
ncbi:tetratricopeptide repeat protein [Arenimonas sp. MALMAid1274]|uniref:tetratricopeptide repeat protein n=1 Tax=Arenimonas sp. MALMAid1274 TaxID=3411630 RepID=UPI003BA172A8